MSDICKTCLVSTNAYPCDNPCSSYLSLQSYPRIVQSLEESLASQEGAARHYFNKVVDLRGVLVDVQDILTCEHTDHISARNESLKRIADALR